MKKFFFILFAALFAGFLGFRLYQETSGSGTAATGSGNGPAFGAGGGGGGSFPRGGRGNVLGNVLVDVAQPEPYVFGASLEAVGEFRPNQQVEVMPRASGYLEQITVNTGDTVRRDQLIAEVDDTNLIQQIRRAEAAIAVARAGLNREQATLENLRVQANRTRELHDQGLVSRQVLEDSDSRVRTAEAQLELSVAQVDQAEASLRELRVQQEQTKVYAPFDGIVAERFVDPGTLVNSNNALVSIVDISRVKIIVPLSETILPEIRPGLSAEISVDAYPDRPATGRVTRISPVVRTETRSADVEIEVPNPAGILRPGMFARVRLAASRSSQALSVPRSALLTRGQQQGVFVLEAEQTAAFRPIEYGRIDGNRVEVLSGITVADTVITVGAQALNDGDTVRLPGPRGGGRGEGAAPFREGAPPTGAPAGASEFQRGGVPGQRPESRRGEERNP